MQCSVSLKERVKSKQEVSGYCNGVSQCNFDERVPDDPRSGQKQCIR